MSRVRTARKFRGAFTLTEMLVVVALILILLGLLLPALQNTMDKGFMIQCMNNMRQLHSATILYVGDNGGFFPRFAIIDDTFSKCPHCAMNMANIGMVDFQHGVLWSYYGSNTASRASLVRCPKDANLVYNTIPTGNLYNFQRNASYSFNHQLNSDINVPGPGININKLVHPEHKIMIVEEHYPNDCYFVWTADVDDQPTDRHFHQGNMMFFDGHLEQFAPAQIYNNAYYFQLF